MSTSRLPLLFFYAILLVPLFSHSFTILQRDDYVAHDCSTSGNVSSNSTFRDNPKNLISILFSNTKIENGFYNGSFGEGTDKVYATGLCSADLTATDCRICINFSGQELLQLCPNEKVGIVWYANCTIRYSNNSLFGVMECTPNQALVNVGVLNFTEDYNKVLNSLFNDLRDNASAGGGFRKFAVGKKNYQDFTIHAVMQCSSDLSEIDCSSCLVHAQSLNQACCSDRLGMRILAPSCNLRMEHYIFLGTVIPVPAPQLAPSVTAKGALGVQLNEWSRRVQISLKARTCASSNYKCLG